jgi:hypothetical protein
MSSRVETAPAWSSFFRGRARRPSSVLACGSKRSSFRRRDRRGLGFTACSSPTGSRATSSMRLRSRSPGGIGGPRPIRSTARRGSRTLMAWARGERRVCSMVCAPSAEDEDRRRLTRERGTLLKERIQHTNRIKGLLSGQRIRIAIRFAAIVRAARRVANRRRARAAVDAEGGNPPRARADRRGDDATGCGRKGALLRDSVSGCWRVKVASLPAPLRFAPLRGRHASGRRKE